MKLPAAVLLALALTLAHASVPAPIPPRGKCSSPDDVCADGLKCVGRPGKLRCFKLRQDGEKCGNDPFWVCDSGLVCGPAQRCVVPIPVKGRCASPDDVCADGATCVGNPGKLKCFKLRQEGEKCGNDPFWVCDSGLVCSPGKKCVVPIPVKGRCSSPDDVCADGATCVGNPGKLKCFKLRQEGEKCGNDPFWVCDSGLVCSSGKRCVVPIPVKGRCSSPDDVCADGATCVGNPGKLKCFKLRQEGEKCGNDPFWVCDSGLVCSPGKRCVVPIPVKGRCSSPDDVCADGATCVGNPGKLKCFKLRQEGEKCGNDPFWVCDSGLVCSSGKRCVVPIPVKGRCSSPDDVCADGATCVGNPGKLKCFKLRQEGEKCGNDPFWVCDAGLTCVDKKCVA